MGRWKLALCLIAILILGYILGYGSGASRAGELELRLGKLKAEYDNLKARYGRLEERYITLNQCYSRLNATYQALLSKYQKLLEDYQELMEKYEYLQRVGLVFGGLNITDLKVVRHYDVIGNVTNISNRSMPEVYVFLFVFNDDGTLREYHVDQIYNLWPGETNPFEFRYVLDREDQPFRVVAIGNYGLTDIEVEEIAKLLAEIERLKKEVEEFKSMLKWGVYVLEDMEYYKSLIQDLRRANSSIVVAMYLMIYDPDDPVDYANDLIRELVEARKRGVNITVILEYRTYRGYLDENLETYHYLKAHNITVILDNDTETDHMKIVIIDEKIVYLGSHNWTESGLCYNHEVSVKIISKELAKALEEYVEGIYTS